MRGGGVWAKVKDLRVDGRTASIHGDMRRPHTCGWGWCPMGKILRKSVRIGITRWLVVGGDGPAGVRGPYLRVPSPEGADARRGSGKWVSKDRIGGRVGERRADE